jgi:hypothetical protein
MRTWVKVTLAGVVALAVGFVALAGTGAYFFFRHLDTKTATEAETKTDFDVVRTRFAGRAPMIEVVNLSSRDLKVNRLRHPEGRRAETVHILTWSDDENTFLRTDVPLWLMRFSSVNVLSHLGIAPAKYRLTVEDLARFGPGIVVDYLQPGRRRVLIWLE